MKNLYEELDTMCLRCECRGDLKCGTLIHCEPYKNVYNALKILEETITENAELEKKTAKLVKTVNMLLIMLER